MNLLNDGMINIHKHFSELEKGWDGYDADKIDSDVLRSLKNMSFVNKMVVIFRQVGFKESDIYIMPIPDGNIQYEADANNVYLEITVDSKSFLKWEQEFEKVK